VIAAIIISSSSSSAGFFSSASRAAGSPPAAPVVELILGRLLGALLEGDRAWGHGAAADTGRAAGHTRLVWFGL
jgi:hypothetical protein